MAQFNWFQLTTTNTMVYSMKMDLFAGILTRSKITIHRTPLQINLEIVASTDPSKKSNIDIPHKLHIVFWVDVGSFGTVSKPSLTIITVLILILVHRRRGLPNKTIDDPWCDPTRIIVQAKFTQRTAPQYFLKKRRRTLGLVAIPSFEHRF